MNNPFKRNRTVYAEDTGGQIARLIDYATARNRLILALVTVLVLLVGAIGYGYVDEHTSRVAQGHTITKLSNTVGDLSSVTHEQSNTVASLRDLVTKLSNGQSTLSQLVELNQQTLNAQQQSLANQQRLLNNQLANQKQDDAFFELIRQLVLATTPQQLTPVLKALMGFTGFGGPTILYSGLTPAQAALTPSSPLRSPLPTAAPSPSPPVAPPPTILPPITIPPITIPKCINVVGMPVCAP